MEKTRVYTKALSNSLRDNLKEQLSAIVYPESGYREYLAQIATVRDSVADEFTDLNGFLDDSRNERERSVAIKLVNLPTDQEIPMPPVDGGALKHIKKGKYLSENLLALVSSMFGAPYSMFCEGKGLINNLIPSRKASGDLTGLGATSDLRFHIENAALRFMTEHDCAPKALFIIGVRQDRSPPYTRLSDARLALDLLSADDRHVLASAAFKIKLPYRWRAYRCDYEAAATEFVPLVEFGSTHTVVSAAFYGDMIGETASDRAKAAAERFEDALEQVAIDEIVAPGEMLGIDNRCTLHARTPFEASFDELGRAHRWAQRIFIADSLANFVGWHETDRPVFAPTFVPGRAN